MSPDESKRSNLSNKTAEYMRRRHERCALPSPEHYSPDFSEASLHQFLNIEACFICPHDISHLLLSAYVPPRCRRGKIFNANFLPLAENVAPHPGKFSSVKHWLVLCGHEVSRALLRKRAATCTWRKETDITARNAIDERAPTATQFQAGTVGHLVAHQAHLKHVVLRIVKLREDRSPISWSCCKRSLSSLLPLTSHLFSGTYRASDISGFGAAVHPPPSWK